MELLFNGPQTEGVLVKTMKKKFDYYWNGEKGLAELIWIVSAVMLNIPLLMFIKQ